MPESSTPLGIKKQSFLKSAFLLECGWNIPRESKSERKHSKLKKNWLIVSLTILYVCPCSFLCLLTHCMCVCTWRPNDNVRHYSSAIQFCLRQSLPLAWRWLFRERQGPSVYFSLVLELQARANTASFLCRLRLKLRSLCLYCILPTKLSQAQLHKLLRWKAEMYKHCSIHASGISHLHQGSFVP